MHCLSAYHQQSYRTNSSLLKSAIRHDLQMLTTKGYFIFGDKSEINLNNKLVIEGIVAEVLITLNMQLKLLSTMI